MDTTRSTTSPAGRTFSTKYKFTWSLTNFGGSLVSGVYGSLLLYFYQTYLALGADWIGAAALIYAIWNAINDPLFGFISDSTKSKKGRRIPYMRFTAPFLALTFVLVWLVPINLSQEATFWWMLITMLAYDTCYTIIFLMDSALLPEVTENEHERGELNKYASVFYLLGVIFGFLLPDLLRPKVGDPTLGPLYAGVVGIGVLGAACILLKTYKVQERPEFTQVDKPLGLWQSIKYTFQSKSFLLLTAANFMSILMQQIVLSSMFYVADYISQTSTIVLLIPLILGLLAGTLAANKFASKWGVATANQVLLVTSGIPLILILVFPVELIYVGLAFAGFGLSGPLVLTNVLYAQVADEDEIKTGVRREAVFFGVNALFTKPAQSVALALGAALIEGAGFIPAQGGNIVINQPREVLIAIRVFVGVIPGIAMLLGALILHWYPLRGLYLQQIQEKVLVMHAEKQAKLHQQERAR